MLGIGNSYGYNATLEAIKHKLIIKRDLRNGNPKTETAANAAGNPELRFQVFLSVLSQTILFNLGRFTPFLSHKF